MVAMPVVLRPSSAGGVITLVAKLVSTEANAGVPVTEDGSEALETSIFSVCETNFGKVN